LANKKGANIKGLALPFLGDSKYSIEAWVFLKPFSYENTFGRDGL
jgi:hypothetical protein